MLRRRSDRIWAGRVAAVLVIAGITAYLLTVGPDEAGALASVLGLAVAAAALVAPYLLPSDDEERPAPQGLQRVANTVVAGHVTQVRHAKSVRVRNAVPLGSAPADKLEASPSPVRQEGQQVNGVWVGGNLTQVDGADGDITIG
jgi:hypothetical protein